LIADDKTITDESKNCGGRCSDKKSEIENPNWSFFQ